MNAGKLVGGCVVVAGHVCLDLIPAFGAEAALPAPGGLAEVGPLTVAPGGAVANTGLALHRLGAAVRLVALVGDDLLGRGLKEALLAAGADVRLDSRPGLATSYSVVLALPGSDRRFLHAPGANHAFDPDAVPDAVLDGAAALHFGYPTLMRRVHADGGAALARLFARAAARRLLTSLDMAHPDAAGRRVDWASFLRRVLPSVSLFCPSADEFRVLLGQDEHRTIGDLAETALDLGAAAAVIKCAAAGLHLRVTTDAARLARARLPANWRGATLHAPCFKTTVISTTGAGDCTIAGLLAAALRGLGPEESLTMASAVGACSVEVLDATSGVRPWAAVEERVRAGWERARV